MSEPTTRASLESLATHTANLLKQHEDDLKNCETLLAQLEKLSTLLKEEARAERQRRIDNTGLLVKNRLGFAAAEARTEVSIRARESQERRLIVVNVDGERMKWVHILIGPEDRYDQIQVEMDLDVDDRREMTEGWTAIDDFSFAKLVEELKGAIQH